MSVMTAPQPAIAVPTTVTPEDLLLMDDGKRYELVDGKLEELDVSMLSSYVAGKVYKVLERYVEAGNLGWVFPESTSFRCFPDDRNKVRRPDVSFIALDRLTAQQATTEGHCPVAPDLVVEVISPNDYVKLVKQKIAEWRRAGVRLIWVIDPDQKEIDVYDREQPKSTANWGEADTLTGDPVLPGFAVPAADLFRLPVPQQPPAGTT